jgi:hypothetical protein
MSQNDVIEFCKTVRDRSKENIEAFNVLLRNGNFGVAIGLLRQEVDSLIRVSYLSELGANSDEAKRLIADFVAGKQWYRTSPNGKKQRITDREMVDSQCGWISLVYSFGCKLIHLSDYHSYTRNDPFLKMEDREKEEIIEYLRYYHHYPYSSISLNLFIDYLPNVMEKILSNSNSYVEQIEEDTGIRTHHRDGT